MPNTTRARFPHGRTIALAAVTIAIGFGCSLRAQNPEEKDPVLRDFQKRVASYVDVQKRLALQGPPMKSTSEPAKTEASENALAVRLKTARAEAKQGDIFAPPIAARLRELMNPELRGRGSSETRSAIRD